MTGMLLQRRRWGPGLALLVMLLAGSPAGAETKTIARCGAGFLEEVDGYKVLHLRGTPYQMGYQHGALLKEPIHALAKFFLKEKLLTFTIKLGGIQVKPRPIITGITRVQQKFLPARYLDEMRGLADGAGLPLQDVIDANLSSELLHCSGYALSGSATKDGTLYQGRMLDYVTDWKLQEYPVLILAEPEGRIPFLNVCFAGFVGCITGMNARHVAIGQMSGRSIGHWDGVAMAFLVRKALEEGDDLDSALAVFRDAKRTSEHYYVISDGKSGRAAVLEGSWDTFWVARMGESHPKLPHAIPGAVVLSLDERYEELARRVKAGHGTFDADSARALMTRDIMLKENLHAVLFEPGSTRLWVANAAPDGRPAVDQPYHAFRYDELRGHAPDPSAAALPPPPAEVPAPAATDPAQSATTGRAGGMSKAP